MLSSRKCPLDGRSGVANGEGTKGGSARSAKPSCWPRQAVERVRMSSPRPCLDMMSHQQLVVRSIEAVYLCLEKDLLDGALGGVHN